MDLTPAEIDDLAAFFARRFPKADDRESLAAQLGLPHQSGPSSSARSAWSELLHAAALAGSLPRLGLIAARSDLHDQNLQAVCSLLCGKPKPGTALLLPRLPKGGAAAAIAVAAMVAAGVFALAGPSASARPAGSEAAPPGLTVEAIALARPAAGSDREAAALVAVAPMDPRDGSKKEAVLATAAPSPAAVEAPAKRDAKRDAKIDRPTGSALGRCTRPDGGVVGYYYAGDRSPGVAGDVIDAPGPVNVRADYPDEHNGFDARAPVRCTLGPGDQLKLTADPIEVPGAAYWVPVHSGDLLRP